MWAASSQPAAIIALTLLVVEVGAFGLEVEHAGPAVLAQLRQGEGELRPVAVVEGEHDRLRRQGGAVEPGVLDLVEGHRLVAVLVEPFQLVAEVRTAIRRAPGRARRPAPPRARGTRGSAPDRYAVPSPVGASSCGPRGVRRPVRCRPPLPPASAAGCSRRLDARQPGSDAATSDRGGSRRRQNRRRRLGAARRPPRASAASARRPVARHPVEAIMVGEGTMPATDTGTSPRRCERRLSRAGAVAAAGGIPCTWSAAPSATSCSAAGSADIDLVVDRRRGGAGGRARRRGGRARALRHRQGRASTARGRHRQRSRRDLSAPRCLARGGAGREHRGRPRAARLHGQRDGDTAAAASRS